MAASDIDEMVAIEDADIETEVRARHRPVLHGGTPCPGCCCRCRGGRACGVLAALALLDKSRARIAALEAENARLRAALETTALRIDTDDCQACWCAGTFVRREGAHQGACRQARKVLADAPSAASTEAD